MGVKVGGGGIGSRVKGRGRNGYIRFNARKSNLVPS